MSNDNLPVTENIRQLSRLVNNLIHQLRAHRDILRQRGMDVPPGSMKGLEDIHIKLEGLVPRIGEQNNELERLRSLANTTAVITSSLEVDDVLKTVMDKVLELTGARSGYIMLKDDETGEFTVRIVREHDKDTEENDHKSETITLSRTVVEEVARTGIPVLTTNAQDDERFAGQQSVVGMSLRSILCVPLTSKGKVKGVVYTENSIRDGIFGEKELKLLVAFANQAALAIDNARLFQQAQQTLQEITRIKTLLDNILASIVSGVITIDAHNLVTTFNTGAENILHLPIDTVLGEHIGHAIPAIYHEISTTIEKVKIHERSVTIESEPVVREGDKRNLNLKVSPLKNAEDVTQGIALVVDDLTELKKRDATLQAVRRYLPPAMVDNIQSIEGIGLGGVSREITVLFVDVRPFTSFPVQLQAGQLMELLNLYLTVGTEAVHRRSGLIDKYMGSEIMALFNTQLNPSDNHALDAVGAALDMIKDFYTLYSRLGDYPEVPYFRIGIHTGEATLGNVGGANRREFSAIGDTVNLAKRIEENTKQGQFFISENTLNLCRPQLEKASGIEVVSGGSLQVKGRKQPVQIYELQLR